MAKTFQHWPKVLHLYTHYFAANWINLNRIFGISFSELVSLWNISWAKMVDVATFLRSVVHVFQYTWAIRCIISLYFDIIYFEWPFCFCRHLELLEDHFTTFYRLPLRYVTLLLLVFFSFPFPKHSWLFFISFYFLLCLHKTVLLLFYVLCLHKTVLLLFYVLCLHKTV